MPAALNPYTRRASLLPLLALCVAACAPQEQSATQPDEATTTSALSEPAATDAAAAPAPPKASARSVSEENPLFTFDYSYPAAAAAIPALSALLDKDLADARAKLAQQAREDSKSAKESGYPFNPHSHSVEWQVVTDLPGWLSLSTLIGFYSGGAHPNYTFDGIVWDRAANTRRKATDLFTSPAALSAAIKAPFCKGLEKARAQKRKGLDWQPGSISEFDQCIDPLEQTIILGSAGGKAFDRIGFLIAPYAAGPYAEGSYEVTLPVTEKVMAAVKPEYRAAFAMP